MKRHIPGMPIMIASAFVLVCAIGLSACGSAPSRAVDIGAVIGQRANSVSVGPSLQLQGLVHTWVTQGADVSIVSSDGVPTVKRTMDLAVTGNNDLYKRDEIAAEQSTVVSAILGTRATAPQADVLDAVALAARSVINGPGIREIDVFDSGLQTTAPLAFQYGLLSESPGSVVSFLKLCGELPDLAGIKVVWYGLGQTVEPQATLSTADYNALRNIWTAILHASGAASIVIEPAPLPSVSQVSSTLPPVTPVPVTAPSALQGDTAGPPLIVTLDPTTVDFVPNESEYLDPSRADQVLSGVAQEIKSGGYTHVHLVGTTALPPGITLSDARAQAVADTLVADGIPTTSLTVQGVGEAFAGFVPDIEPDGSLNGVAAQQDRLVIITATH